MNAYTQAERDANRSKRIVDHRQAWERLTPLALANGSTLERVQAFAATKRISLDALFALGTRVRVDPHGEIELAWGFPAPSNGAITAVKVRPLGDKPRYALEPSTFLSPLVIGRRDSLDWFVAEGETDGARLFDLVGDVGAVLVLPAGALTFKREWAATIPRGATVHLCHDADEAGDTGAAKAEHVLGGRTVRVRPPTDGGDWCDWAGGRDEFVQEVQLARAATRSYEFAPLSGFLEHAYPPAEPLLLTADGEPLLGLGFLVLVYGDDGAGKSTFTIDAIAHLAAGRDWLGLTVLRPVRILVIENEGPPSMFQRKIADKATSWDGDDWTDNVFVYKAPWGSFSFADADARAAITAFCDEHTVDLVTANPTLALGVAATGRPDETQRFVDWLRECGLGASRAFWLLHHENKAGQISGDWGRHPDTKVQLQADGNRPRTKLVWEKTRWASLPTEAQPKACMLEWVTETKGYTVVELDSTGASDAELEQRILYYLTEHPLSSTRDVQAGVTGTNNRIAALLKAKFDCVDGRGNAKLWFTPLSASATSDDAPTHTGGNPHG